MLHVTTQIQIPDSEFSVRFDRSSGPGGQNVNKVNTKVTLWWDVLQTPSLNDEVKQRFLTKYASRLTNDGQIVVRSERYRDQARNLEDCRNKLCEMVQSVATPPKQRKPTKPTWGSRKRRKATKEKRSEKKQRRQRPNSDW